MKFLHSLFILALVLIISDSSAQQPFRNIDRQLDGLNRHFSFTGSVLVAKKGRIVYQRHVGFADLEHHVLIDSDTKFELASITKVFTAVLILQLVEKGKLKLDAKVSDYIPAFTRKDSGDITIHHLLSHTSGIEDFVGLNCPFSDWTEKEFFAGLQQTPVHFTPGARFEYASSTYILLRLIIEHVTGQTYERNLQEHILRPAGMKSTGVIHNHALLLQRAFGYVNTNEGYENAMPISNHDIFVGAASVYSTTTDLLKFDRALYSNTLLSENLKKEMFTIVRPPYGYGWFINDDDKDGKTVSHGGDIFGFTSLIERRLKDQVLIVILSNQQGLDRELIVKLLDETLR